MSHNNTKIEYVLYKLRRITDWKHLKIRFRIKIRQLSIIIKTAKEKRLETFEMTADVLILIGSL